MAAPSSGLVPARLGFLAIYNPSLGATDETVDNQIVYYASVNSNTGQPRRRHRSRAGKPTDNTSQDERNERLRQIGLAQGMVEFSKSFSGDKPVDTIETEKSRVILHELEPGWWILASIDLTRLPLSSSKGTISGPSPGAGAKGKTTGQPPQPPVESVEYSSREVKPSALLLQDLLRAHSVFLLHHDSSLSALFVRSQRAKFASILGRYWDIFLSTWDVLLHGNPIRNVFGGIKIAACGELGVGVGEEERGSGEREVLEGFVGRIEGLVDLVVGKFGEADSEETSTRSGLDHSRNLDHPWLGGGTEAGAEDGAIFLGVGALSKHSLRDITYWMEDIYSWGENAYGVVDSPTATRPRQKRPRAASSKNTLPLPPPSDPMLPPPLKGLPGVNNREPLPTTQPTSAEAPIPKTGTVDVPETGGGVDKFMSYLKLGYGTAWGPGAASGPTETASPSREGASASEMPRDAPAGSYLIGLMGDIEETGESSEPSETPASSVDEPEANSRILLRTVTVELEPGEAGVPESEVTKDLGSHDGDLREHKVGTHGHQTEFTSKSFDSQDRNLTKKLRVVVYVNKPFIFAFLFHLRTDSLAWDGLYRSLHYQLAPLRKPLVGSTSYRPARPDMGSVAAQIYDLIWDPRAMTVHSTIPNIPEPGALSAAPVGEQPPWTRVEALNTHTQLLNTFAGTRIDPSELERTCKTSRGWWVVWSRIMERELPPSPASATGTQRGSSDPNSDNDTEDGDDIMPTEDYIVSKEIVLIRKAGEHLGSGLRGVSGSYVAGGTGGASWADGASRLAQGIGVDTRKYIEGLLNLNR